MRFVKLVCFVVLLFIVCSSAGFAKKIDSIPIKKGLYVREDMKCRKVEGVLELDDDEFLTSGEDGRVGGLDDMSFYNTFKHVTHKGNDYIVDVESRPNSGWKGTNNDVWDIVINSPTSFTIESDSKKTTYKYCGDQE